MSTILSPLWLYTSAAMMLAFLRGACRTLVLADMVASRF